MMRLMTMGESLVMFTSDPVFHG